jgi:hypothetical protein
MQFVLSIVLVSKESGHSLIGSPSQTLTMLQPKGQLGCIPINKLETIQHLGSHILLAAFISLKVCG